MKRISARQHRSPRRFAAFGRQIVFGALLLGGCAAAWAENCIYPRWNAEAYNVPYTGDDTEQVAAEALLPGIDPATHPGVTIGAISCTQISGDIGEGTAHDACVQSYVCDQPTCSGRQDLTTSVEVYQTCETPFWAQLMAPITGEIASSNIGADPINPSTGVMFREETDFQFAGTSPISFSRLYSSGADGWTHSYSRRIRSNKFQVQLRAPPDTGTYVSDFKSPEGACSIGLSGLKYYRSSEWGAATAAMTPYGCSITGPSGSLGLLRIYSTKEAYPPDNDPLHPAPILSYVATRDDGQELNFTVNGTALVPPVGSTLRLAVTSSGFTITDEDDAVEAYDSNGKLVSITHRGGIVENFSYDSAARLNLIQDSFGHALALLYDSAGHVASVWNGSTAVATYVYDANGRFEWVEHADASTRYYHYDDSRFPRALTSITDELSIDYLAWTYDDQGRGLSFTGPGGAGASSVSYQYDGAYLTSATGGSSRLIYVRVGERDLAQSVTGARCPGCADGKGVTYDANGFVSSRTDYNDVVTTFTNDSLGRETSRTEAVGTPVERIISTVWHAMFRLPTLISEPGRTTSFSYDSVGNLLSRTETDTATSHSRAWTFTRDSFGRVLTENGPRTDVADVTTYTYNGCTTGAGECGQLATLTDALGHVTTVLTYDAAGQPLTVSDPNGVVTTYSYDARERATSVQLGSETTTFSYWPTGLVKRITQPDGSYQETSYDDAHRAVAASDTVGNTVAQTLDASGNWTVSQASDASNAIRRARYRAFDTNGWLTQEIGSANNSSVTTALSHDGEGRLTYETHPMGRYPRTSYDELGRPTTIANGASESALIAYDALDQPTDIQDPRGLTTSYSYNGLGDLLQQVSPDSGTTINTYDSAGNVSTTEDARNVIATLTYDKLNRVSSVDYGDQTIAFRYDAGIYGKGHLTAASDASQSLAWTYNAQGQMTSRQQVVGGVTLTLGQGYTHERVTSLSLPSGASVTVGRDANGQVSSMSLGGTSILSNVAYDPDGAVTGWTWGNSTSTTRAFNQDGLITGIVSSESKTLSYDNAFRLTGVTDATVPANSWSYDYDAADRLTGAVGTALSQGWTYDSNGNRLSETGTTASTFNVSATSNRLTSTVGFLNRAYSYDAAGHVLTYDTVTATYNNRGRLASLTNGSITANYVYNALGQMVKQSGGPAGTRLYAYDDDGHLIGEYASTGALIQETVWLGDVPVATLRPSGMSVTVYYVHTDHLNAPRVVTRPSDNAVMWRWDTDPFGTQAANEDPSSLGTFEYSLRFPGQTFDGLAGLHQNWLRDYSPATGRFTGSDPIGLMGGSLSTYSYADGGPILYIDPTGLCWVFSQSTGQLTHGGR